MFLRIQTELTHTSPLVNYSKHSISMSLRSQCIKFRDNSHNFYLFNIFFCYSSLFGSSTIWWQKLFLLTQKGSQLTFYVGQVGQMLFYLFYQGTSFMKPSKVDLTQINALFEVRGWGFSLSFANLP